MPRKKIPHYHYDPNDPRPLPERLIDDIGCPLDWGDVSVGDRRYSAYDFLKAVYGSKVARNYQGIEYLYPADLYWLVVTMPHKSALVQAVKIYLADAGVIPYSSELDGINTERYSKLGKPTSWVDVRIRGIVDRNRFTSALECAIVNFFDQVFYHATEELYVGLWERTTAMLRGDLDVDAKQNLRDHMGEYALIYIGLAEKVSASLLNDADEVSFDQAMKIVRTVAEMFHKQAKELSKELGIDLVTDKPLLRLKGQDKRPRLGRP